MIRVPLSDLVERAQERPPGYLDDALSNASSVSETEAVFTDDAYLAVATKYGNPAGAGVVDLAKNAAQAAGRWAAAGFPLTPPNDLELRRVTCAGGVWEGKEVPACQHFRPDALISNCALCGCNGLKLKWATESCPERKWLAVKGA